MQFKEDLRYKIQKLFFNRDTIVSKKELVILFIISGTAHFLISLITESPTVFVTSVSAASQIVEGKILYLDVTSPPTAGYPAWPPIWPYFLALIFFLTGSKEIIAKITIILLTIACGVLVFKLSTSFFSDRGAYYTTILFFINPIILSLSIGGHFESLALLFLLMAVLCAQNNHASWSGVATGLGIMTKLFPVIFIFIVIPFWFGKRQYKEIFFYLFSCALICTLIALPFLIICPNEFFYWILGFHSERNTGGISIIYYWLYSTELWTGSLSFLIQILFLISTSLVIFRKSRNDEIDFHSILIDWSLLNFLGFMMFTRVLYVRYLAFAIPFMCIQTVNAFHTSPCSNSRRISVLQQLCSVFIIIGTCLWTIPWVIEDFRPENMRPPISGIEPYKMLYWIGASVIQLSLIISFFLSLYFIWMMFNKDEKGLKSKSFLDV